jgi:acetyl/propionyl-CoA carboxylase alpha subunit
MCIRDRPITNRDLLVGILREEQFRAGSIDTGYLTRHAPATLVQSASGEQRVPLHALAAALAGQAQRRDQAPVLRTLPSGWRNVPNAPQRVSYTCDGRDIEVQYRLRGDHLDAWVDGTPLPGLRLRSASVDQVDLDVAGTRRRLRVHQVGEQVFVDSALGGSRLVQSPRFPATTAAQAPGSLLAPMPGTVVRVAVEEGQPVSAGSVVVVLEAMKMEHTVVAPHDGTVTEVTVTVGATVDVGHMLAVVVVET